MPKLVKSAVSRSRTLASLVLASALVVWAQVETAQITGVISDQAGGLISSASVKVINTATGAQRDTVTNGSGIYAIPNLEPGSYDVTVSANGFSTSKQHVVLSVGQKFGDDFKLQVGAASTTVEVKEAAVQVNTETQSLTSVIDSKQITELPSLTRDPYDFVATVPNVSPADPSGRGVGYAINGLRAASTNVLLDGVANNNEFSGSVGQPVPLDAVQEYSITTSDFTAEVGRATAGVVNLVTKSGTNSYHGSAYEFNRVSYLASNGFSNNANSIAKGIYDRNQFGYALGGAVIKNKLFFFESLEATRIRSQAPQIALVPTSQFIAASSAATQAFFASYGALRSGLTTLATFTKGQLSPCTKGAAASDPCTALASNFPLFNEVTYTTPSDAGGGTPQNAYNLVGNVDYNWSEKTQFSLKYALYTENDFAGTIVTSPYKGYDTGQSNLNNHVTASLTHSFSPSLIAQTRLSFNRLNNQQPLGSAPVSPTLYMSSSSAVSLAGQLVAFPGYSEYTPSNVIPFGGPQNFAVASEDVTKVIGKHNFRFGGQYTYIQDNRAFGAYENAVESLGTTTGGEIDNFLTGQLKTFQAAVYPQGKFPGQTLTLPVGSPSFSRSNRYKEGALYAQDSWKVTPRLTLNLGLRWEYYGVQHNVNPSLDSNFYPGTGSTLPQQIASGMVYTVPNSPIKSLWNPSWNNYAPRLGFAYDVMGDGKTSIRGGYGIGYERNFGNVTYNVIQNPPNYAVVSLSAGVDLPTIPISVSNAGPLAGSTGTKVLPAVSLRWVDPNIKTAYAHLYSLSMEHQFGTNVIGSVSYSGSAGENLYSIDAFNKVGSGNIYNGVACTPTGGAGGFGNCTARTNSQYGNINGRTNGGISNYNALISRVITKNFWKTGITMDASYTWSHAIDNLSGTFSDGAAQNYNLGFMDPYNPKLDRGNADFDIRHRVAISGIWAVPIFKGSSTMDRYLGGWEIAPIFTAHSGTPYSLYDCSNAYTYCERAQVATSVLPKSGTISVATAGVPDNYQYFTFPTAVTSQVGVWYNPKDGLSDFGPFPANTLGRNTFLTPGTWNLNLGVYKATRITERLSLQLRLELYNAFNHANFVVDGSSYDVSSFNAVDGSFQGNRNVQLGAKILF